MLIEDESNGYEIELKSNCNRNHKNLNSFSFLFSLWDTSIIQIQMDSTNVSTIKGNIFRSTKKCRKKAGGAQIEGRELS